LTVQKLRLPTIFSLAANKQQAPERENHYSQSNIYQGTTIDFLTIFLCSMTKYLITRMLTIDSDNY